MLLLQQYDSKHKCFSILPNFSVFCLTKSSNEIFFKIGHIFYFILLNFFLLGILGMLWICILSNMENFEFFPWNFWTSTNSDIGRSVIVLFLGLFTVLNHNFSFFFLALYYIFLIGIIFSNNFLSFFCYFSMFEVSDWLSPQKMSPKG